MHERLGSRRWTPAAGPSFLILLILVAATIPPAAADRPPTVPPIEAPDQPPGVPAQPVPGAPPAEPMRLGPATTHQVNVSSTGANIPGDAANEPSIAVNRLAPNQMAIGWRQFDTVSSNFRQAGRAFTVDGGRSWVFTGVFTPGVFRSDPVLGSDRNGKFFYSSLTGNFLVDLFSSTDHGATWSPPVAAFGGDKQWFTIDRTTGMGTGHIYQSWSTAAGCCGNNIFTRSTNGGTSFQTPVTIPNLPVWGTLDVAPNGTLFISGSNFGGPLFVARSTNAQDPLVTPTFQVVTVDLGGNLGFSTGPNPGGLLGQLWIAVDPSSGPTAGWIYLLASVDPAGTDPLDVHFARSTNGGVSFSPWVRVNTDPLGPNGWQWFATMAVGPNGRIDAIWNDNRDTGLVNWSALYYSSSTDGGSTWSTNTRISDFWDSFVGWPQQQKIGDYYHLVSDGVGASLAWAATFNNEQDVYHTRIGDYDCNTNGIPDSVDISGGSSPDVNQNGIPDECEETLAVAQGGTSAAGTALRLDSGPNPFSHEAIIRFEVAEAFAPARLAVYDAGGRLVRTLFDGAAESGLRTQVWDGRDASGRRQPSGVYYFRLESGGRSASRSLVRLD